VFSREIRTATFPQRFLQPMTIVKYNGETDPRVWLNDYRLACQLGGATSYEVIIRNLPLHLANSARTWLEHLPASQIHNWDDQVRTFVGNFQGTYVRPGNSWDLCSCTQKPGESLPDFIWRFSKRYTELPSMAQSEIVRPTGSTTSCDPARRHSTASRRASTSSPSGRSTYRSGLARQTTTARRRSPLRWWDSGVRTTPYSGGPATPSS
jgi:hypothetical protein